MAGTVAVRAVSVIGGASAGPPGKLVGRWMSTWRGFEAYVAPNHEPPHGAPTAP